MATLQKRFLLLFPAVLLCALFLHACSSGGGDETAGSDDLTARQSTFLSADTDNVAYIRSCRRHEGSG